jgi:hypothetical protein
VAPKFFSPRLDLIGEIRFSNFFGTGILPVSFAKKLLIITSNYLGLLRVMHKIILRAFYLDSFEKHLIPSLSTAYELLVLGNSVISFGNR